VALEVSDLLPGVELVHTNTVAIGCCKSMATCTEATLPASLDWHFHTDTQVVIEDVVYSQLICEAHCAVKT